MLEAINEKIGVKMPHDNKNSGQSFAQLVAEKDNPVADVVYYGVTTGIKAGKDDLFEPYKPAGFYQILDGLKDPEGKWFVVHYGTIGFFVNVDALSGAPVPQCFADLTKPEYKGMVGYLDPSSDFVGYAAAVAANLAFGGDLENFDPGIDYFKKLAKNDPIVPKQTAYACTVSGEIPILFDYDFNAYRAKYEEDGNFEFVLPCEDSVRVPYVMSLVKNAPHSETGKKVLDFILSDEGQAIWTNAYLQPASPVELPEEVASKFLPTSEKNKQAQTGTKRICSVPSKPLEEPPFVTSRQFAALCLVPLSIFTLAFLALPLVRLVLSSAEGEAGWGVYVQILQNPRYLSTLINTVLVSLAVTAATLLISTTAGLFLVRNRFPGRDALVAILTLPLAFPGVVVGFMLILLGGRQGLVNQLLPGHWIFAYSIFGLFLGYLYFSIPRVLLTVMSAAEKIDPTLEEAVLTLGASSHRIVIDVLLPTLMPTMLAAGAICFATAMGAFGTAFTLATDIDVLPMVIYTEFTLSANFAMASALSVMLDVVTWAMLLIARSFSGATVAAGV